MAVNPNYNPANGTTINSSGGSSVNVQSSTGGTARHKFNWNHKRAQTLRFADITPHYVYDAIGDETVPFGSSHDLRTYTLSSPLLSDVRQIKTYFQVPEDAILPRTWELIYTNPITGSDVPNDAITVIDELTVKKFIDTILGFVKDPDLSLKLRLRSLLTVESVLSYGSLTAYLGCPMSSAWVFINPLTNKESLIDNFIESLAEPLRVAWDVDSLSKVRSRLDSVRYDYVNAPNFTGSTIELENILTSFTWRLYLQRSQTGVDKLPPFNYNRLIAYQLGCAEFFSNEFIDAVYNCKLYRDNAQSIATLVFESTGYSFPSFLYNGTSILYDAFSGRIFSDVLSCVEDGATDMVLGFALDYFQLIFGYRQSLRATDYFTSAKNQPLAVGDVKSPVVANGVSAIDITRNIQAQRFLNAVNKVGRKFSSYMKGIMGTQISPDRHEPHFLAQSSSMISGFEVEQTAPGTGSVDNQVGAQVTLLKSNGGQYEFEMQSDSPCVIIGVTHYDVERLYYDSMDKFFTHLDRYDMFNPFMQYTGDQAIFKSEREYNNGKAMLPYGYQVKYCEYKQTFSRALGGFAAGFLPSWAFTDGFEVNRVNEDVITSDNIRNANVEFDKFYSSLTHIGLAGNWHFISLVNNNSAPARPMEYVSNIL